MRKIWIAAVLAVASAVVATSVAAMRPAPAVSLVARQPVAVRGVHFMPREWVRVTASADATQTVRVHANRTGRFLAGFPGMIVDRCTGLRVRAAGSRGSFAVLKLPLPACLPARNP